MSERPKITIKMITLRNVAFLILAIVAMFALLYILSVDIFKSVFLLSLLYYLAIIAAYMAIMMIIQLIYRVGMATGHPIPGIFSTLAPKTTQETINNLKGHYWGKVAVMLKEFLLMRLDIMVPAGMVFVVTMGVTFPTIATTAINSLALAAVFAVFAVSYLVYTVVQAFMFGVVAAGAFKEEMALDDVISMAFSAAV